MFKKFIYGFGTIAAVVAPVASIIACGKKDEAATKWGVKLDSAGTALAVVIDGKIKSTDLDASIRGAVKDLTAATKVLKVTVTNKAGTPVFEGLVQHQAGATYEIEIAALRAAFQDAFNKGVADANSGIKPECVEGASASRAAGTATA